MRLRGRTTAERDGGGGGCLARGIDPQRSSAALREFRASPHRLEHVAEIGGVEYVNDSKATNVAAAAARSSRSTAACT